MDGTEHSPLPPVGPDRGPLPYSSPLAGPVSNPDEAGRELAALLALRAEPDREADAARKDAAREIGTMIRRARLQARLGQSELARRAGITQAALSDIERGAGRDGPRYRILRQIAAAMNRSLVLQHQEAGTAPGEAILTGPLVLEDGLPGPLRCRARPLLATADVVRMARALLTPESLDRVMRLESSAASRPAGADLWELEAEGTARFSLAVQIPCLLLWLEGRGVVEPAEHLQVTPAASCTRPAEAADLLAETGIVEITLPHPGPARLLTLPLHSLKDPTSEGNG